MYALRLPLSFSTIRTPQRDCTFGDEERAITVGARPGSYFLGEIRRRSYSDITAWLKADGPGYQTKANWLVRQAMTYFRKKGNLTSRETRGRRGGKASYAKGTA